MERYVCELLSFDNAHNIQLTGFSVFFEFQSIYGRSDLTLSNSSAVYLIELKMDHGREPEACYKEGFEQIRKKGYVTRYLASGKNVRVFTLLFSCEGSRWLPG